MPPLNLTGLPGSGKSGANLLKITYLHYVNENQHNFKPILFILAKTRTNINCHFPDVQTGCRQGPIPPSSRGEGAEPATGLHSLAAPQRASAADFNAWRRH
jgi:hypothetical protein